jgi:hypothetical protein
MRHYLLVGQDGVEKTSFVNSLVGSEVFIALDVFCDELEPSIETRVCATPAGDITVSVTRGADPDSHADDEKARRANAIYNHLNEDDFTGILFFIPLDAVRFWPRMGLGPYFYVRTLLRLTERFPRLVQGSLWLVLTRSASVLANDRGRVATSFADGVRQYVAHCFGLCDDAAATCQPYRVLLVDTWVAEWDEQCSPLWKFLIEPNDGCGEKGAMSAKTSPVSFKAVAKLMDDANP